MPRDDHIPPDASATGCEAAFGRPQRFLEQHLVATIIHHKAMPLDAHGDAAHLAMAALYGRHLANARKARHIEAVSKLLGLVATLIITTGIPIAGYPEEDQGMKVIEGIFDGTSVRPLEAIDAVPNTRVIIAVLDEQDDHGMITRTRLEDVAGCLRYNGPAKSLSEMEAAIARGAWERRS